MKLLLYCCKAKPYLYRQDDDTFKLENKIVDEDISDYKKYYGLNNGKIVAECDFEVEKLQIVYGKGWETKTIKGTENIEKLTCLNRDKLYQYCKGNGYAIYIKNLHIFDKPKELADFTTRKPKTYDSLVCDSCTDFGFDCKKCSGFYDYQQVMKAPQNMMKVCECGIEDNILISIRPEWLCKILNGEKTIEVRKKVLKEMLK